MSTARTDDNDKPDSRPRQLEAFRCWLAVPLAPRDRVPFGSLRGLKRRRLEYLDFQKAGKGPELLFAIDVWCHQKLATAQEH